MSTLKANSVTSRSGSDLVLTGDSGNVVDIETAFKVSGTTGLPVSDIRAGTDGELITWGADGSATTVSVGTATHVLTSNGTGAAPTFQAAGGGGGKILQYITATSSTQTDVNTTTWTDVTGATGTITPASASNRILILSQLTGTGSGTGNNRYTKLLRGATAISEYAPYTEAENWHESYQMMMFIDHPNTTSATTYKIQCKLYESAQWRVNFSSTNGLCFSLLEIDGT